MMGQILLVKVTQYAQTTFYTIQAFNKTQNIYPFCINKQFGCSVNSHSHDHMISLRHGRRVFKVFTVYLLYCLTVYFNTHAKAFTIVTQQWE